ncbi:hypothetical protein CUC44_14160 [Aeromonas lusitana]|uniref:Bacterioferritin-associated ferredoxin n=2 Tax=Aeromonas lusitana TaxID=931529 RepID=A0A2M8H7F8_9GAMM|nr:hypothetical protein CUC44_14160 [Aeromonas lusitana]
MAGKRGILLPIGICTTNHSHLDFFSFQHEVRTMYVCLCRGITDTQIRKAVQAGKTEFRQLKQSLEVGAQCGKCVRMAMEIIAAELDKTDSDQVPLYYKVA